MPAEAMRRLRASVLLSVVLHALIVFGVSRVYWDAPPPVAEPRVIAAWLARIERPAVQAPVVPPPSPPESIEPNPGEQPAPRRSVAEPTPRAAPSPQPATPAEAVAPSAPTAPDEDIATRLSEAQRRASFELNTQRERDDSARSFLFPGTIGEERAFHESEQLRRVERGLQQPLTAFDSPSKGRAGMIEPVGGGQTILWISDDCYRLLGRPNPFLLFPGGVAPIAACARPRPRGDLFATSKPSYLMDAEEQAETDEVFRRRERLRRETTGAVLPLAEP